MSILDSKSRERKMDSLKACTSEGLVSVILVGQASSQLSETLFSILQHAQCPRSLRITLVESVSEFQSQSSTIVAYSNAVKARGRYFDAFLDVIKVHQTMSDCVMYEAVHLAPVERPLTLVCTEKAKFLLDWDVGLVDNYNEVGPLFCGSVQSAAGSVSAFTAVDLFKSQVPSIGPRPLFKNGPSMPVVWASWPMLMRTTDFKTMQGCKPGDSALLLTHSNLKVFTTRKPVATVDSCDRASFTDKEYLSFANKAYAQKDFLLGTNISKASQLEIIMKYGSIGNFQWAMS